MGAGGVLSYISSGVINANKLLGVDLTTLTGIAKFTAGVSSIATANTDYQLPFTTTNDTNVTGSLSGSVFTLGWTSVLAKARIISTAVYNDQTNAYSVGLQDFSLVTLKIPIGAGLAESVSGRLGYDSTANLYKFGVNGTSRIVALLKGSFSNNDCPKFESSSGMLVPSGAVCGGGGGSGNLTFKGTWNSGTTYATNDMVTLNGFSYIALAPNTNVVVSTAATWSPIIGDSNNNISTPGTLSTGVGSGDASVEAMAGGTQTLAAAPANSTGWIGPTSVTGQHFYQPPGVAAAAHQVAIFGAESSAVSIMAFHTIPDCVLGSLTFTQSSDTFGCIPPSGATTSQIYTTAAVTAPVIGNWSTIGSGCTRSSTNTGPTGGATLNIIGTTSTANICGYQTTVAGGNFTHTFIFFCMEPAGGSTTDSFIGFTDGTKVEGMGCTEPGANVGSGSITGIKSTALTGGSYTAANGLVTPASSPTSIPVIAQLSRVGTTLTGKVSFDGGVTYLTVFSDTSPFLTASALMVYVDPRGSTAATAGTATLISYN